MPMQDQKQNVIIIGGGIAGIESAIQLSSLGYKVDIIEKEPHTGGHVKQWKKTFPYLHEAKDVIHALQETLAQTSVEIHTDTQISWIEKKQNRFQLTTDKNRLFIADAVLLSTGFQLFDAHKKEEYGYGIFKNVITNADLEKIFNTAWPTNGKQPSKFGFIHCVGSRDAKSGNLHCSKVCCATAVKQAIEVREHFPNAEIYCFYMDLRMFGKHYEELFQEAQEKHTIHFIRARLSEVNQNFDNTLLIKIEDTLTSKPMKLTLDYIVLMSGMEAAPGTRQLESMFGLALDENGFLSSGESVLTDNLSPVKGVFYAGTVTGPKTIIETLNDSRAAALNIHAFLSGSQQHQPHTL